VSAVVEALVSKYVALTAEELEEWRDDPEGYIRCVTRAASVMHVWHV
jgi:hypothetical protein